MPNIEKVMNVLKRIIRSAYNNIRTFHFDNTEFYKLYKNMLISQSSFGCRKSFFECFEGNQRTFSLFQNVLQLVE